MNKSAWNKSAWHCCLMRDDSEAAQIEHQPPADYWFIGTCVHKVDKTRLKGVQVRLFAMRGLLGDGEEVADTLTDKTGVFIRFRGLARPSELHTQRLRYVVVASFKEGPAQEYPIGVFGGFRGITIEFASELDSLKGRVVDESGNPVQGALVRTTFRAPPKTEGTPFYETQEDGLFLLQDLPVTNPDQGVYQVSFFVSHPDFPAVRVPNNKVPGGVRVTIHEHIRDHLLHACAAVRFVRRREETDCKDSWMPYGNTAIHFSAINLFVDLRFPRFLLSKQRDCGVVNESRL